MHTKKNRHTLTSAGTCTCGCELCFIFLDRVNFGFPWPWPHFRRAHAQNDEFFVYTTNGLILFFGTRQNFLTFFCHREYNFGTPPSQDNFGRKCAVLTQEARVNLQIAPFAQLVATVASGTLSVSAQGAMRRLPQFLIQRELFTSPTLSCLSSISLSPPSLHLPLPSQSLPPPTPADARSHLPHAYGIDFKATSDHYLSNTLFTSSRTLYLTAIQGRHESGMAWRGCRDTWLQCEQENCARSKFFYSELAFLKWE